MITSLKRKAVSGMLWTALEQSMLQGVRFVVSVVIARFLMPADYGIIPMLGLIYAICSTFIDSGMGTALIRKVNRTEDDYSTLFYFNLLLSIVCYIFLFCAAPFIATFFNLPILTIVTRVTAINFVIGAFGTVQRTRLSINLDFKPLTIIDLSMSVTAGVVGIYMAYRGCGVWALIFPGLLTSALGTLIIWRVTGWCPKMKFSWQSFRELFGFGSKILCSSLINTVYSNLSTVVIGKLYTPTDLGLYGRGSHFAQFPCSFIQGMILRVTYPLLSKVNREDPERVKIIYKRVLRLPVFILAPVLVGLAVVASPLIQFLLGAQWLPCVPILQIACMGCIWNPLTHLNLNLLYISGRSDLVLKLEIVKKSIAFLMLISSFKFGVIGIVIAMALYDFVAYSFNCYYTGKFYGFGELKQLCLFLPIFVNVAIMGIGVWGMMELFLTPLTKLIVGIPLGAAIYIFLAVLMRDSTMSEFMLYLKQSYSFRRR